MHGFTNVVVQAGTDEAEIIYGLVRNVQPFASRLSSMWMPGRYSYRRPKFSVASGRLPGVLRVARPQRHVEVVFGIAPVSAP